MEAGTVAEIWRYPVKSMGGERLGATSIGPDGVPGDRSFGIIDLRTGKVLSAKTVPALLEVTACWDAGTVHFAQGPVAGTSSDDDEVHARLSAWLGRPVELRPPVPGDRVPFDQPNDPDDPSEVTELQTPPGRFFDSRSTLHLITDASLEGAAAAHPTGDWDRRRFRPNLVVRAHGREFPEETWVGGRLRIGSMEASVRKAAGRCVVVAQAQPGLPRDSGVFRALARERGGKLGIYLDPSTAGEVATGDRVEPLA